MTDFTTRILKGGALMPESRRLFEVWDDEESVGGNLERIRNHNLLGFPSRTRAQDALQILRQRFVDPKPSIIPSLRIASRSSSVLREACYFEATRNDDLLGIGAETLLFDWWERGRASVDARGYEAALLEVGGGVERWGEGTRRRVVQSMLASYRDFGILEGKNNKQIAPPSLSLGGFAYVVGRLRQQGDGDVAANQAWRRWLLDDDRVRGLFLEADRLGLLHYAEAGSVTRIDWIFDDLEEVVSAAV